MNIEGKGIFVSQFNKFLDIALIWIGLYLWLRWPPLLGMVAIGFAASLMIFMLHLYNEDTEKKYGTCYCDTCKKYDKLHLSETKVDFLTKKI